MRFAMCSASTRLAKVLVLSAVCAFVFLYMCKASISWPTTLERLQPQRPIFEDEPQAQTIGVEKLKQVALVVASQATDNTS